MDKTLRLNTFSTAISSIVGIIAIGLIVWRGGGLAMWVTSVDEKYTAKFMVLDRRVNSLETDGSSKVQRHIDTDEKLQARDEVRLTKLENAVEDIRRILGEMNGDSKVIRRSVDDLVSQINLRLK